MPSLSGLLLRNWTLKVSAFGVALLLWAAVRAESENSQEVSGVPVDVRLSDPAWSMADVPTPSSVTVRFAGPSRSLMGLAFDRPVVEIPLDRVVSADTVVLLRPSWVRGPEGVIAEDIQPSSVRLTFEPIEREQFSVELDLVGELPGRLAMAAAPIVDPPQVWLVGARSRLARVDSVGLVPVDLSTVSSTGSLLVAVDTAGLGGLQVQPAEVRVQLQVADRIDADVSGVPIVLPDGLRSNGALQVRPATASVVLRGARPLVERPDAFNGLSLVVQIDAQEIPPPGTEREFPLLLRGIPPLLTGTPRQGTAIVRNGGEPPR